MYNKKNPSQFSIGSSLKLRLFSFLLFLIVGCVPSKAPTANSAATIASASLASGNFQLASIENSPALLATNLDCTQIGPGWVAVPSTITPTTDNTVLKLANAAPTPASSGCTYPGNSADIPLVGIPPVICSLFQGTTTDTVCSIPRAVFLRGAKGPHYKRDHTDNGTVTVLETATPIEGFTFIEKNISVTTPPPPVTQQPSRRINMGTSSKDRCLDTYNGRDYEGFMNICASNTSGSFWLILPVDSSPTRYQLTNTFLLSNGLCLSHQLVTEHTITTSNRIIMEACNTGEKPTPNTIWNQIPGSNGLQFQLVNAQTGACLSTLGATAPNYYVSGGTATECASKTPNTLWDIFLPK